MKTRCTALIFLSFLLFAFPAHSQSALPAHEWTADQLKAMHGMQTNLALLIAHAALNFQSEKGEQRSITPAKTTYAAKPNPAMMSENEDILSKNNGKDWYYTALYKGDDFVDFSMQAFITMPVWGEANGSLTAEEQPKSSGSEDRRWILKMNGTPVASYQWAKKNGTTYGFIKISRAPL